MSDIPCMSPPIAACCLVRCTSLRNVESDLPEVSNKEMAPDALLMQCIPWISYQTQQVSCKPLTTIDLSTLTWPNGARKRADCGHGVLTTKDLSCFVQNKYNSAPSWYLGGEGMHLDFEKCLRAMPNLKPMCPSQALRKQLYSARSAPCRL